MIQDRYNLAMRSDNQSAFVTFVILNDFFLPGALMQAYALKRQLTRADTVCLVTPDISPNAREALQTVFDYVVVVDPILIKCKPSERRQDLPWLLTRLNALRLGSDGDLGFGYQKIVFLDADVLPLKHYDHLFLVDSPGGVLNERPGNLITRDKHGRQDKPALVDIAGRWVWHEIYREYGHGSSIPREITDRVKFDPSNVGINTALLVLEPSIAEYGAILEDVHRDEMKALLINVFDWPDMQYLTLWWSGKWHNVDACFCGINGYPSLSVLFGTHLAGIKPWDQKRWKSVKHHSKYPDFHYWFLQFLCMMRDYPILNGVRKLSLLKQKIGELALPAEV